MYFTEADGYVDQLIYDRASFGSGTQLTGPAVVEEFDSTTVLHPGYRAEIDGFGNLIIRPAPFGSASDTRAPRD